MAPAAVLTEWLRVMRVDSSAVDETTECGLRSRFGRPRDLVGIGNISSSADCSEAAASRFRVDLVDRPAGSERFRTGLRGSTDGDGIGDPI